jgi:RNA polymerase-binding protein DksA
MDSTHRDAARASLTAERERLTKETGEAVALPEQMTYGSQAAAATQVFEQERELALRERASLHLEAVERALARLNHDTYGTCIRCGRPIAVARLEALPWAEHCIDCQTLIDRGRR